MPNLGLTNITVSTFESDYGGGGMKTEIEIVFRSKERISVSDAHTLKLVEKHLAP